MYCLTCTHTLRAYTVAGILLNYRQRVRAHSHIRTIACRRKRMTLNESVANECAESIDGGAISDGEDIED